MTHVNQMPKCKPFLDVIQYKFGWVTAVVSTITKGSPVCFLCSAVWFYFLKQRKCGWFNLVPVAECLAHTWFTLVLQLFERRQWPAHAAGRAPSAHRPSRFDIWGEVLSGIIRLPWRSPFHGTPMPMELGELHPLWLIILPVSTSGLCWFCSDG